MTNAILVVEDNKGLQNSLKELLLNNGYLVTTAADGIAALEAISNNEPDIVVIDMGLANINREAVCLEIRKRYPTLPMIILNVTESISDIVHVLNLSPDDYIKKPFASDEFLGRIKKKFGKINDSNELMTIADLTLNNKTFEVKRSGKQIRLTPLEFKLLEYLIHNQGRILTRAMILNRIWLYSSDVETRVVDVYIGYLRKKIDLGHKKKLIHSVRGFGYVIKE